MPRPPCRAFRFRASIVSGCGMRTITSRTVAAFAAVIPGRRHAVAVASAKKRAWSNAVTVLARKTIGEPSMFSARTATAHPAWHVCVGVAVQVQAVLPIGVPFAMTRRGEVYTTVLFTTSTAASLSRIKVSTRSTPSTTDRSAVSLSAMNCSLLVTSSPFAK
jgi:hypothetical protein